MNRVTALVLFFLLIPAPLPAAAAARTLEWTRVLPGIWSAAVGRPDSVHFLQTAGVSPRREALEAMGDVPCPLEPALIRGEVREGKTLLHFPLEKGERIFGLGLHFKTVEQRGRILRLHMDHYGGTDNGRTHAPVPFYVSSRGYGIWINSARYIDIWVGTAVRKDSRHPPEVRDRNTDRQWTARPYSDNVEAVIAAEGAEVYLFGGPGLLDVVRRYNLFQGGGCLPPRWGLGFWHRVPTLYTADQVRGEVEEFARHGFPLSVIGLEPGWQSRSYPCTYEWDRGRFPDPAGLAADLKRRGIYLNLWLNPYISPQSELFQPIEPYTASHTVWAGLVPDYSRKEVQELLGRHFRKHHLDQGVSGYKMDENDGYDSWLWPDSAEFPSGISAEQMRTLYGVMMQKLATSLFRERNLRTYGLVRATNSGAASFPFVVYNDYYSHPDFITALVNSSFLGVLWTPEVRSSRTAEEWLRRMQSVCFSPLAMLNAWSDGTKPWSFPEVETQVREIAQLRLRLLPYLYNCFADYAFYGTPPVRAMNLDPGFAAAAEEVAGAVDSSANPYGEAIRREIKDQFLLGDSLLVAPLFAGQSQRKVILPKGKWYDFYTGRPAGDGEILTVAPGLDRIPVYVRDGGIIPMLEEGLRIPDGKVPLEIRHYGSKDAVYELYDDDGSSYDYEKGKFSRIRLAVTGGESGEKKGSVAVPKGSRLWSYSDFRWVFPSN